MRANCRPADGPAPDLGRPPDTSIEPPRGSAQSCRDAPLYEEAEMTTQTMHRAPVVELAAVDAERLYDHLVDDHGRAPHEILGLPLDAVHELEHFDVEMGL